MRIAMVSEHASPLAVLGGEDAGGQNVHVAALASALADRGHDVEVYTRRDGDALPPAVPLRPGVDVVHVPAGPPRPLPKDDLLPYMPRFGAWLAARWRRGGAPDVVHSHFWMSGIAALHARARVPVPVAHTYHALGVVKRRHQGAKDTSPAPRIALESRIAAEADALVATCTDEIRELIALGADPVRLHVVPCGVDLAAFTPTSGRAAGTAADGAPPPRRARYRLLCLGRLVERKGVDTVIEALAALPDTELLVAGGPDPAAVGTDPDCRRLLAAAARHGVADRVRLLGRTTREQAPRLIRSADVLVSLPWYEPFGIVPLEAMACGVPVVTSAVGGMLDTVLDGVTGLHVPPADPRALARALAGLLADPARRAAMGRAGAAHAAARYGWGRVAELTEDVYHQLTAGRAVVPGAGITVQGRAAG